jgi:ABC-type branched-subunit amino acid transport system substrate-binding protein
MLRKKLTALVAVVALAGAAAACGDDGGGAAPTTTAATATTTEATTATTASTDTTTAEVTTTEAPKELTAVPGFDGTTIKVGILVPLSGAAAIIGKPLLTGQEAYWLWVNDNGGVAGKYKVELVVEDTLYETNTTVQKYNKIKNDVVTFAQVMGTPHNLALLPLLREDDMVSAPASQDAFWVREQNMLPVIEPYQIDVINGISYYLDEGGGAGKTVCGLFQNDVYGEAGLEGLTFAATEFGFEIKASPRFKLGDTDFTAQVTELRNAGCEGVWLTALPSELGGIMGTAARLGYTPQWLAQSPAWIDELGNTPLKDYLEAYVWIVSVGPE